MNKYENLERKLNQLEEKQKELEIGLQYFQVLFPISGDRILWENCSSCYEDEKIKKYTAFSGVMLIKYGIVYGGLMYALMN